MILCLDEFSVINDDDISPNEEYVFPVFESYIQQLENKIFTSELNLLKFIKKIVFSVSNGKSKEGGIKYICFPPLTFFIKKFLLREYLHSFMFRANDS